MTSAAVVVLSPTELEELVRRAVREELAAERPAVRERGGPELLTAVEAARELRCSTRKLRRLIATARLRATRLGDGGSSRVLISRSEIERLLVESERW